MLTLINWRIRGAEEKEEKPTGRDLFRIVTPRPDGDGRWESYFPLRPVNNARSSAQAIVVGEEMIASIIAATTAVITRNKRTRTHSINNSTAPLHKSRDITS